jgi:hypothetical protein
MARLVLADLIEGFHGRREIGETASCGLGEALRSEGCDRQWGMWFLMRGEGALTVVALGPECENPIEGLVETVSFLGRIDAKGLEHRLLKATAESDQQASSRDSVESCDFGCNFLGWVKRKQ